MNLLISLLDIIFPSHCMACGIRGSELCVPCLSSFPVAERESEKWIFPLFDYRHPPLKLAIHHLKYKGKRRLARVFGEVMYGRILEELGDLVVMENFRESLLIPIPLSKARHRTRGFNQAELLCNELIKMDENAATFTLSKNILIKPKDTLHQASIKNRSARLKNLIGSFAVNNKEEIYGKNIILIDDVTTTGATLAEARKTLRAAGARRVIAFTIAH